MKQNGALKVVAIVLGVVAFLVVILGWIFGDNLQGYNRYQDYCKKEGGLRVFQELERDVGWFASDVHEARTAAALSHVRFVRYREQQTSEEYDLRYIGGPLGLSSSYRAEKADISAEPIYVFRSVSEFIPQERRLRRWGNEVVDIRSNRVVASYFSFTYSKFDPNRTLLGAPSNDSCFAAPGQWREALSQAFKH